MVASKYRPLPWQAGDLILDSQVHEGKGRSNGQKLSLIHVALMFFISLSLFQSWLLYRTEELPGSDRRPGVATQIANLRWDTPTPLTYKSNWNNPNRTAEDEAWELPDFDTATAVVAVPALWAESNGMLPSQRWPWDESKSIYIVNAMHTLHCVKALRESLLQYRGGQRQTIEWPHLKHCFDVLRQEVMCNAGDTLLYSGRVNSQSDAEAPHPGIGQERICRNWTALVDWARRNSACYRPISEDSVANFQESDRYKFCPDGATPWNA